MVNVGDVIASFTSLLSCERISALHFFYVWLASLTTTLHKNDDDDDDEDDCNDNVARYFYHHMARSGFRGTSASAGGDCTPRLKAACLSSTPFEMWAHTRCWDRHAY